MKRLYLRLCLRLGALILCLPFSLATAQAQTQNATFAPNAKDLPLKHWGLEAIRGLSEKYPIFSLYPDQTFRGDQSVTRYELAGALWHLMQWMNIRETELFRHYSFYCRISSDFELLALPLVASSDLMAFSCPVYAKKNDPLTLAVMQQPPLDQAALAAFQPAFESLQQKVTHQERLQLHGQVEVRYRDRVAAQTDLEFADLASQPFSSPKQTYLTTQDLEPFQVRTQLRLQATLTDEFKVFTGVDLLTPTLVENGGHDLNEGSAVPSPWVFREGYLDWLHFPQADLGLELKAGLFNFGQDLNSGTRFKSHFDQPFWNGHSYGLVGWGANEWVIPASHPTEANKSLYKYWVGGLNPSMVDPDSQNYNQASAPSLSFQTNWEGGAYFIGLNGGSFQTNRAVAAQGNLRGGSQLLSAELVNNPIDRSAIFPGAVLQGVTCFEHAVKGNTCGTLANHLALPSQAGDGYLVTGLELFGFEELFPLRLNLSAMTYLNDSILEFAKPTRKELSGTLDLGWNQGFGVSLGVNKSFVGFDRYSLGVYLNQLGGSDVDFQIGANLATQQGLFNFRDIPFSNFGFVLSLPLFKPVTGFDQITVLLAARQSLGENWGRLTSLQSAVQPPLFKEAGMTLALDYGKIAGTPLQLRAEYHVLFLDALWQFKSVAQDLVLITRYPF